MRLGVAAGGCWGAFAPELPQAADVPTTPMAMSAAAPAVAARRRAKNSDLMAFPSSAMWAIVPALSGPD